MSEDNKNDKNENPRTAEKVIFCCECEDCIESIPESRKNQIETNNFLKKHQSHIKLIGTRNQIQESSYYHTTKKDMKRDQEYSDYLAKYIKDIFDNANKKTKK